MIKCGRFYPRRREEYVDSKRRDSIIERRRVMTSKNGILIKLLLLVSCIVCFQESNLVVWSYFLFQNRIYTELALLW